MFANKVSHACVFGDAPSCSRCWDLLCATMLHIKAVWGRALMQKTQVWPCRYLDNTPIFTMESGQEKRSRTS